MRVLLRDKEDQTLIALEVQEVIYDPEDQELTLFGEDGSYTISGIVRANADSYTKELFEEGKADLTMFAAEADEE